MRTDFLRKPEFAIAVLSASVCLGYTLFTGHIWEDFFITYRHSENLCAGNGLAFQPGERVHGFTSPLGVLLPALCHLLGGMGSYLQAIWIFRLLFCIPAFAGAALYSYKFFKNRTPYGENAGIIAASLLCLDVKSVMFSVNGMETAFMLLFIGMALYHLMGKERRDMLLAGVAFGGLMWTRPDSFIYIGAMGLGCLYAFKGERLERFKSLLKSGCLCAAVYLPWFIWAWSYYGTPIPQTIKAKGGTIFQHAQELLHYGATLPMQKLMQTLAPPYLRLNILTWPPTLVYACLAFSLLALACALLPKKDAGSKLLSISFLCVLPYIFIIQSFPWYFPPFTFLEILLLTWAFAAFAKKVNFSGARAFLPAVPLACLSASLFFLAAVEMKVQQEFIENGNREKIGLWLKTHMRPGDRVYLECIGYIGYFSGAKVLDYPGLASPEVSVHVRAGRSFGDIIPILMPEWLVLREYELLISNPEFLKKHYAVVQIFDVRKEILSAWVPSGRDYMMPDALFFVLKKTDAPQIAVQRK